MATAKRISRIEICGTFIELYKLYPQPRYMGRFFIASREKWQRKCQVLQSGLTQGGADLFPEKVNPTATLELISQKKKEKPVVLKRAGKKYLLS